MTERRKTLNGRKEWEIIKHLKKDCDMQLNEMSELPLSLLYQGNVSQSLVSHSIFPHPVLTTLRSGLSNNSFPFLHIISLFCHTFSSNSILSFFPPALPFSSYQSPLSLTRTLLPCPLKPSLPPISFILLLLLHPLPPHLNAPDSFSWTTSHSSNKSNLLTLVLCLMTSFRGPRCDIVISVSGHHYQKPRTVSV